MPLSPKGEEPCGKKRKKAKVDEVSTSDGEKEEEMERGEQSFHGTGIGFMRADRVLFVVIGFAA